MELTGPLAGLRGETRCGSDAGSGPSRGLGGTVAAGAGTWPCKCRGAVRSLPAPPASAVTGPAPSPVELRPRVAVPGRGAGGPGAPGARGRRLAAGRELAVRMNESMNESMTRMNGRRSGALPGKITSERANPAFWGVVAPLHEAGARSDVGCQDPERGVGKREWRGAGWECGSAFSCPRGGA